MSTEPAGRLPEPAGRLPEPGDGSREVTVLTHRRSAKTEAALGQLMAAARQAGMTLRFDAEETRKHDLSPGDGVLVNAPMSDTVRLCLVLGGDGTILSALRRYAHTGVPVFGVNFGEIGFLATVEPDELEGGLARAFAGDFKLLRLPAVTLQTQDATATAINDIAIHRKVGDRVAEIAYALNGEVVGSVRCDGLVVATPAGSTGYNLANGGPVMAWGVEGFVVSFIAPHSLTARALVAAPGDLLSIFNRSRESLDVAVDGRPVSEIEPGGAMDARFVHGAGTIAQLPGSSFYRRLREKFGRLAH